MHSSHSRRVAGALLGFGSCALVTLLVVVRAASPQVLFVTGSTGLGLGDSAVKARLEATGHVVTVRAASSGGLGDVTGKDLVIISSSAPAATVAATFKNTAIGVITWQSAIFDDMALTGTVSGTDFGTALHFTEVVISTSAPPAPSPATPKDPGSLTAYLPRVPGIITVASGEAPFSWGKPGPAAFVIATLGDSTKAAIFAYEQGKNLVGTPILKTQARRVGLFMTDNTPSLFNDDGWKLFDAAVEWVVFKNSAPVVDAGDDRTVDPRDISTVILADATATDDSMPYPTTFSVTWTKFAGPGSIVFAPPTQAITDITVPPPSSPGAFDVYTLRISATDDGGLTTITDDMTLTVSNGCAPPILPAPPVCQNRAPKVEPGTYAPVTVASPLPLLGSVTDEGLPVGGPVTYAWSKLSGPGSATFTPNATALSTSVTFGAPGLYDLQLCVTDGPTASGGLTACKTTPTPISVKPHALLVVGSALNGTGDTAIKTRLENLGYTVTAKTIPTAADANNKNIVVIAATAVDANVTNKFRPVTQGVLVLKHSLLDDMSMTAATAGSFGTSTGQTQVTITAPTDPLAAGLSGTVTVTAAATYTWGLVSTLPAAAIKVATLAADPAKATIFRYDTGAPMFATLPATFPAPGPRVAFFAQDVAANAFTTEGGWLFDAAVGRAANLNLSPRADAGPNRSQILQLPAGTNITLNGRCIDDGLPGPCTFQWTDVTPNSCPATIVGSSDAKDLSLQFLVTVPQCRYRLTVSDGFGTAFDEADVYVSNPNVAPQVSVTAPPSVLVSGTASLGAVVVDDGLPNPPGATTVTWSKISGPGTVVFTPPLTTSAPHNATATFSVKGTYVIQAIASDGTLSGSGTATIEARKPALLVVDNSANLGDILLRNRMSALSFEVTMLDSATASTASASNMSVVVVAPTAVPAEVATDFNLVTVPVVYLNEALFNVNRLTTAANLGVLTGQTDISISSILATDPAYGMTAGMVGVTSVSKRASFAWGVPAAAAKKIATLVSDPTKWVVFGYEQGAAMVTSTAQRRRVGFFARTDTVTQLTTNGLALFDAVVSWAAQENMPPRVTLPPTLATEKNATLNLSGAATDDGLPAPANIQFAWTQQSGPPTGGVAQIAFPIASSTSVTFSAPGPYVLRLSAFDGELTGYAEVAVSVVVGNQAPIVSAGPDLTDAPGGLGSITFPNSGQLVGMAVDDGLPSPLVVSWSKVAGPGTAKFTTPSAPVSSVTFDAKGRYVLRLTANDGAATPYDDVVVDVNGAAVLITATSTLDSTETAIKTRLEKLGFSVAVVAAAGSTYSNADNMSLVFISPSVVDADVLTKFRTVATPVITTKASLLDDMALVATSGSQGTVALQTSIAISTPTHPMAAGNSSPPAVGVLLTGTTIGWGTAGPNATKVATQVGQVNRATLFGYEKGVGLPVAGVTAPARRVGFLFCTPTSFTSNGWLHFDAALRWATSNNAPPRVVVGLDQVITLPATPPATATVSGTVFDDGQPSPGTTTKTWSSDAGPSGVGIATPTNTPTSSSTVVTFPEAGIYVLRLSANDGSLTGSDQLTITVRSNTTPTSERPYVNAGVDQTIRLPNTATLSGLVSDDGLPYGSTVLLKWTKVLGPGSASNPTFANNAGAQTTATFSTAGVYVLRLTANDSGATSACTVPLPAGCATDDVTVVVEATKSALLVVPASGALTPSETLIRDRLTALAFTVTIADDGVANLTALAAARKLVFVGNVDPLLVGTQLQGVAVPVIVSKATLYPDMAMADSDVPGVDFGETTGQTQVTITNPTLPLAAWLSGTITLTTAPATFGFAGKLLDEWKAAEIFSIPVDRGTLFGYDEGVTMLAALRAPARRIGFPSAEASLFTPEAWTLFDAAVRWATERVVPALYVDGSCGSGYDEKETRRHLAMQGYAVTIKGDTAVTAADASGKAIVVISRSVCAPTLGSKLRDVEVPVITFDPENFANMMMTGSTSGNDYGTTLDQTRVVVLDPSHPLAGRQTGVVEVLSASNGDFGWALPSSSAARVAVTVGFSYGATVFGYEKDQQMVGLAAPARRVGLYMNENSVQKFKDGGWAILDAALQWCGAEDADNDGLSTFDEFRAGTDPFNPDTNGDGVPDGAQAFTDRGATNTDMDADGLTNALELQKGTDPFNADTDGDKTLDGADCFPLDPAYPTPLQCPTSTPGDTTPPGITLTEPTNTVLISSVP